MNHQLPLRLLREQLFLISLVAGTRRVANCGWLLALLLIGLSNLSWGQCFLTGTYPSGDLPYSIAVGDFNGDGKADLATANYGTGANTVSVLLSNGGSFGPTINYRVGLDPISVAVSDFNGDGKADLVTTNQKSNDVSIVLGNGSGSFGAPTSFTVGTRPQSVVVGDFNDDGKPDLAVTTGNSANTYTVSILLNSNGSFGTVNAIAVGSSPNSMVVGDFNRDGKPDLAIATGDNNVSLLLGNSDGTFGAAIKTPVPEQPLRMAIGDFNGDGRADLVVTSEPNMGSTERPKVSVLFGNGDGNFGVGLSILEVLSVSSVVVGDFNGDGKADLALSAAFENIPVLLGDGNGSFGAAVNFRSSGDSPQSIAVGDFNGDRKPDLAIANSGSDNVTVLYNCTNSPPANTAPTVANAIPPQSATVNQGFTLSLANTFTDVQTPNALTLSVSGLPAGLSLVGTTISGTPSASGVSTVTVKATDPDNFSVSTTFTLTVNPASTPPGLTFFAITGATTVNCQVITAGERLVTFTPQYSGLNGQPVTFQVVNELAATTAVGPYSLRLYTDNPIITLKAQQSGTANEAQFSYNWLSACSGPAPANTAPTVANAIPNQSGTVGQGFSYPIPANTFADAETPNALLLSASGLPTGMSLAGSVISGTPSASGVSTVTITATDPGSLAVNTTFILTINPTSTPVQPSNFAITGVTTVNCQVVTAGERLVTFTPQYSGLTGSLVSFSVANELAATTAAGPYILRLYTDNPVITLQAQQGSQGSSLSYNWLAACGNPSARLGTGESRGKLQVRVLGNPVQNQTLTVLVQGAAGQSVQLRVVDQQGRTVVERLVEQATDNDEQSLSLQGQPAGLLLLQVSTAQQRQTVKVVKQ